MCMYLPTHLHNQKVFFMQSLTGLNSEFSFSSTDNQAKAKKLSLSYYFTGGRIIGFIPFPRILVLSEMQTALSRNWTLVATSIS